MINTKFKKSQSFGSVNLSLPLIATFLGQLFFAQNIIHQNIFSKKMNKNIPVVVIMPNIEKGVRYKTVYILHGYSGNSERTYKKDIPDLIQKSNLYKTIYVLPDGNYNSWYVDSPIDKSSQYTTFIGNELVDEIDKKFPTIRNRNSRGILGWSMGGFGALHIGITFPDTFSIVGSTCGAVDVKYFGKEYTDYQIDKFLGNKNNLSDTIQVVTNIDKMKHANQYYILDCGTEDTQMIKMNRLFHQYLTEGGIIHSYTEYPGEHNTDYWSKALSIQLTLFNSYFHN